MFPLQIPNKLGDRLSDVVSAVNRDSKVQASTSDVIEAALVTALENGGLAALKRACLRARVTADARRHERRRLATGDARSGVHKTPGNVA